MRRIVEERRNLPVNREVDVVVAGGGKAGFAAAVDAVRLAGIGKADDVHNNAS